MIARSNRPLTRTKVHRMPKMYGATTVPAKRRPRFRSCFNVVFWLGIVGACFYAVFLSPWLRVSRIEVKGSVFTDPESFKSKVELGQHIAFIPKQRIEYEILQNPAVESVQMLRGLPDSIRIVVTEKVPAIIWISKGTANILDERGEVFAQFPENALPDTKSDIGSHLINIEKVYDRQNMPVKIGQRVISPLFINFINSAHSELGRNLPEFPVLQFEVIGSSFFDVQVSMQGGLTAEFNVLADAGVQARNLGRLMHISHIPNTSHVDLRVDRWAYVK